MFLHAKIGFSNQIRQGEGDMGQSASTSVYLWISTSCTSNICWWLSESCSRKFGTKKIVAAHRLVGCINWSYKFCIDNGTCDIRDNQELKLECDDGAEEGEDSVIHWTDLEVPGANSSDKWFSYSARNPVLNNREGAMVYYVNN